MIFSFQNLDSLNGNDFFKRNTKAREHAIEELVRHSHYPHVLREHFHARLNKQQLADDKDKQKKDFIRKINQIHRKNNMQSY